MSNRKPSFIDRVRSFIWRNWQGQVLIGPQDPVPPSSLALVTREYLRACSERGRGPHIEGKDLARAAAVYASPDRLVVEHTGMSPWPWPERCDEINQLTRVEQLTRAAVLCMREIDRLREGGAVAQDHFAGGGKMVDNKGPTAAPCEREEPTVAAAKVAADKQPWERELERLGKVQWSKDSADVFHDALNKYGSLQALDKLRRVVDSGQGSAEVPRAIIDRYPLADGKPRGEGCWMCCKSERLPEFEVFCDRGNFRDVFWTFGTTLNAFIHAAGNEMVAK